MVRTRATVMRSLRDPFWTTAATSRSRRRCCRRCTAAPRRGRSTPTSTRSICDMSLRIATELYLKRCIVGGIEKVYEIGRHLPQRGHRLDALPGVHDARGLRGLRRLRHDGRIDPRSSFWPRPTASGVATPVTRRRREIDLTGEWRSVTLHEPSPTRSAKRSRRHGRRELRRLRRGAATWRCAPSGTPARSCSSSTRSSSSTPLCSRRSSVTTRRGAAAGPPPPRRSAPGRGLGPRHRRGRDRRRPTPSWSTRSSSVAAGRAVAGRGRRRPGGDAARRGLPARARVRHAADGRHGPGRRSAESCCSPGAGIRETILFPLLKPH